MEIYKLIFINNGVASCKKVTDSAIVEGSFHYVHKDGKLIYAMVKAETEEMALQIAQQINRSVKEKVLGNDVAE